MEDIKSQIREFIGFGRTEEALTLLEQLTTDAVLLQSRYNAIKRRYSMGLIDFKTLAWMEAQINYAILELVCHGQVVDDFSINEPITPSTPVIKNFANVEVGDEVYVCPAWSGPFSGEGWERVTKISQYTDPETNITIIIFKAGQWFNQNGDAHTKPWGFQVTQLRKNK